MSRQEDHKRGEWATFLATLLIVGLVVLWFFVPTQVLETTWQAEQQQMSWIGESTHHWIKAQAARILGTMTRHVERATAGLGESAIEYWLRDRIYISLLWSNLALYRLHALLMWSFLGIPLILAASVDGFYVREIRKTAFISQSPIRHRLGVHFFRLVSLAVVAWLCLPFQIPIFIAPLVVCFMAVSLWLWVGHLQKRL
jgi:hypothetical protein